VPGYVSTEVDARLSYDTEGTIARARRIIAMYEAAGISKERVLIKIASTWEGIRACEVLQKEGISCNLTLLFSLTQAAACAEAGATLISPFVGRIMDYYKAQTGKTYAPAEDPGVQSVTKIFSYFRTFGYNTIVMGASFRNTGEITELAGCDRLTIAPKFLDELAESTKPLERKLAPGRRSDVAKLEGTEAAFRWAMGKDPMATMKLADGIRKFSADIEALEAVVRSKVATRRAAGKSSYAQLAALTTIVADTGDIKAIRKVQPTDATTNPSLLYKAATMPEYAGLLDDAVAKAKAASGSGAPAVDVIIDQLNVNFGKEILGIVPGYVSTEVDARLSYDTEGTIARARRIIAMYEAAGISKERVLIKIASTWEGIRACEVLQKEGISCNLTLLFSLTQAAACAEAGATLISPFVGRIMDYYKAQTGKTYAPAEDPGVQSVTKIFSYFRTFGYNTIVMGASFRNTGEITELAGCDRLTIAPKLIDELQGMTDAVPQKLSAATATYAGPKLEVDEASFRRMLNDDAMATEKLAEGIRKFAVDIVKLEQFIEKHLTEA